jgi:DNA polymerase elongation subunit (family B)
MDFPRKEAPILKESEELTFQILDWYIPENDRNNKKRLEDDEEPDLYSMMIYGATQNGNTVAVNIIGYEPYFYIKPPESWENYSDNKFLAEVSSLQSHIENGTYKCIFKRDGRETKYDKKILTRRYESHLKSIEIVKKKEFWGFTYNTDFRYIKITTKSLFLFNNLKYYFQSLKKQGFQLYESNIDPFLRYIHEQNIKPCGWVSVKDYDINEDNNTRCDYNIEINYKNIKPVDINNIAPLLIASFDIECTSSHGDFPVAKKDYRKVAQDLANVAKAGYNITEEFLLYWFETMYDSDAIIDDDLKIHQVYPKKTINFNDYKNRISNISKEIIELLNKISDISEDSDEDGDDNEIAEKAKKITLKEQNVLEGKINAILTDILPPLKGDKIIQIGTTVHRYGSDEIIYKNIISLNSCDSIEGADVKACKTEKQVLMEWKNLIAALNPDILTGYNIFGFDMEYIYMRVIENNILDDFTRGLGRKLTRSSSLVKQELSSSALGENILKYFDMDGTVVIDLFKVIQRDHKLDSYKLDNVANIFLGDRKDDLKPHEIFEKFKGTSQDRCIIAKYCIQDCALVNRLLHKLKILENNIGMGNVCLVPLNYLFKRGQGIKIFSLIAKQCMDKNHLIPVIRSFECEYDIEGYEGAVVLEPKEGIYLDDPIVVFDYGSLYPSSMIARNLSHDCYVMNPKYQIPDPNIDYMTVSYDLYEGIGDKKKKVGIKECVFAQYKDGRKGIISDILCMLLQERKNTRKKMEYQTITTKDGKDIFGLLTEHDSSYELFNIDTNVKINIDKNLVINIKDTYNKFEQDVFDALQLAYKITANSLYGQIGARTSPVYLKDIAACTTATGREMIMLAKDFVEKNYNAEVIYGDSVMPYTPITYKTSDQIYLSTFDKIGDECCWIPYNNFKPYDNDRYNKEQYIPNNTYVWTHKGWSKIRRIIRHKTVKKIFRIITKNGLVDVTEDHSLLDKDVNIIKPKDCYIGKALLHSKPTIEPSNDNINNYCGYQAYIYGQFIANGRCYIYNGDHGMSCLWEISNIKYDILNKCKEYLEILEDNIKFEIIQTESKYILRCINTSNNMKYILQFIEKYKSDCYYNNFKIVPRKILNSSKNILKEFKGGLDDAYNIMEYSININHQITAQSYILLLQILDYDINIKYSEDYIIINYNELFTSNVNNITNIIELYDKYNGYVYDIETEEGVFHGGVGNLILKNTDSIFCKFPLKDKDGNKVYGKASLEYAIEVGKHVEKNIVSIMPNPQKLNYEKSLYPFILFSKKRYVGNLYETDVNKFKQKSMGIVLKRRDNAPIVKKIYGGIIDILLNQQDLHESIKYLRSELKDLVEGKSPITDLIISKSLRASYKDATKIPHKVLADRIGERDPGNKPQVNDRIPFVYIKVPDAKLQGDRIENPDYIIENGLIPDYLHYITNQIMNPVLQLYALCLDELPNYDKSIEYWQELDKELKKKPIYQDDIKRKNRIDNLKLNMVRELLFDEFINILMEPKIKKERKKKISDDIPIELPSDINELHIENIELDIENVLEGIIKIIAKRKENTIEASAKLIKENKGKNKKNNKEELWNYTNNNCNDKIKDTIQIILNMVEIAKKENMKINIKLNNKTFITDYHRALMAYKTLEQAAKNNENIIELAIKSCDVGVIKDVHKILIYEKMIKYSNYYTFI